MWAEKAPLIGVPRDEAVGFSSNNVGFVGLGSDNNNTALADFWKYDPNGSGLGTWSALPNFPGGPTRNAIGVKGWVGLGTSGDNEMFFIDTLTGTWSGIPKTYVGSKTVSPFFSVIQGNIYIGTGFISGNLPMRKDFWMNNALIKSGKEYAENVPSDALKFQGHDWTSEGDKLYTSFDGVKTTARGDFQVNGNFIANKEVSIGSLNKIIIKDNGIQSYNGSLSQDLNIQPNGNQAIIGTFSHYHPYPATLHIDENPLLNAIGDNGGFTIGENTTSQLNYSLSFGGNIIQSRYGGVAGDMILQKFGGKIGIGENIPSAKLHIKGLDGTENSHIRLEDDNSSTYGSIYYNNSLIFKNSSGSGDFYFVNNAGTNIMFMNETGDFTIAGDQAYKTGSTTTWNISSDRRLKKNISKYLGGLSDIMKINPVKYQYNGLRSQDSLGFHIGVIAQELKEIAPYMVFEENNSEKYLNINNSAMTYMLINAVKEQQQIIEGLKEKNNELNNKNDAQTASIHDLSARLLKLEKLFLTNQKQ